MKIPTKTLHSGFEMPVFGIGTSRMGGRYERDMNNDDARDINAIQEAISLGVTHIDTAESYANGYTEILVGKAIEGANRSSLFLVSKLHKMHLAYDDVISHCKASLERLQTTYLDLYLIHQPSPDVPIQETMRAFDFLVEEGLIRNIGVSNFTTKSMIEAQSATNNRIVVNQVYYNLVVREPEYDGLLEYCQKNDVILEAFRPIEKGALLSASPMLEQIANKYGKTPAQIAINWLISQKNVVTISKSSTVEHLRENLGAVGWELDQNDIEKLRKEFPNQQRRSDVLPLK